MSQIAAERVPRRLALAAAKGPVNRVYAYRRFSLICEPLVHHFLNGGTLFVARHAIRIQLTKNPFGTLELFGAPPKFGRDLTGDWVASSRSVFPCSSGAFQGALGSGATSA